MGRQGRGTAPAKRTSKKVASSAATHPSAAKLRTGARAKPAESAPADAAQPGPAEADRVVPDAAADVVAPVAPDPRPSGVPTVITREHVVTGAPAEALYQAYLDNMEPLAELAVLRHVDSRADVLAQLANPRIVKIVAWQANEPIGLAMVTNSLEDVAEISPAFLRSRYPEHAARDAIYVGMLVLVSKQVRGLTVFSRLYTELWQIPAQAAGVLVFDVCEFNRTTFATDSLAERIAAMFPRSSVAMLDRQTWYVADLPEPLPGTAPHDR